MAKQAITVIESPLVALVPRTHAVTLKVSGSEAWQIVNDLRRSTDESIREWAEDMADALMAP